MALFGVNMIQHGQSYEVLRKLNALQEEDFEVLSSPEKMKILRENIQKNLELAHNKNERRYNLRSKEISYTLGQEIYRRLFPLSSVPNNISAKFCKKFARGRIMSVLSHNRYEVSDLKGKSVGIYHVKDLKIM